MAPSGLGGKKGWATYQWARVRGSKVSARVKEQLGEKRSFLCSDRERAQVCLGGGTKQKFKSKRVPDIYFPKNEAGG